MLTGNKLNPMKKQISFWKNISLKKNLSIPLNKLNFNTPEKIPTPPEKISDTFENISTTPETV